MREVFVVKESEATTLLSETADILEDFIAWWKSHDDRDPPGQVLRLQEYAQRIRAVLVEDKQCEPDHPLDICYCGDYRKDHIDGKDACKFSIGARGDGHSGAGRCDRFVFAYPHTHRTKSKSLND